MGNPSHVTMQWRHVTQKGQTRDHNTIRAQYLGTRLELAAQQTVPDTRSLDGKASIAIFCPRSRNDQRSRLCRTQVTTTSALWPCLEVVLSSRQPLRHIRHWITRKPLEIEASFQRTTNEMVSGESKSVVIMQWRHVTPKGQTRDHNTIRA